MNLKNQIDRMPPVVRDAYWKQIGKMQVDAEANPLFDQSVPRLHRPAVKLRPDVAMKADPLAREIWDTMRCAGDTSLLIEYGMLDKDTRYRFQFLAYSLKEGHIRIPRKINWVREITYDTILLIFLVAVFHWVF
jgi:hypothetical protein